MLFFDETAVGDKLRAYYLKGNHSNSELAATREHLMTTVQELSAEFQRNNADIHVAVQREKGSGALAGVILCVWGKTNVLKAEVTANLVRLPAGDYYVGYAGGIKELMKGLLAEVQAMMDAAQSQAGAA